MLQTRLPEHPVVQAVLRGDPDLATADDLARRQALRYPPAAALAMVSGAGAPAWAEAASASARPAGAELVGPSDDGRWLARAADASILADWLAAIARPTARTRIEVDPPRA